MRCLRWASWVAAIALGAAALDAAAAEQAAVLVDFESPDGCQVQTFGCAAEVVPLGAGPRAGRGLRVGNEAGVEYPRVRLTVPAGPWNLAAFDAVAVDVRNLDDVPLRVLLSADNADSNGREGCSVQSLVIGPQGTGEVLTPFGVWHNESDRPFDKTRVAAIQVSLDRPGQAHRFVVDNVRAVALDRRDLAALKRAPYFAQMPNLLGRGVNLGNALEAPRGANWGLKLEAAHFDRIRDAGFDSIRLPVRWSDYAAETAPYTIEPEFFDRVDWAVEQALSRNLKLVLNVHHYDELTDDPSGHRERFLAIWRQLAEHYRDRPETLFFELLNEPRAPLAADAWNELAAAALAEVRRTNPRRWVVIGPVDFNAIRALRSLRLPEQDQRLIVTVHYYLPFGFTHQGAAWLGQQAPPLGTPWRGTDAERAAIRRDFDAALAWAVDHRRPVYLGEFGAYERADLESRIRWTRAVAEAAAERKFSLAYWEFGSGFGLYDPTTNVWIERLLKAVLPEARTAR